MADTRGSTVRIPAAEKRALVVELRRQRKTFEEIGRALGCSTNHAWRLYNEALAAIPAQHVDAHRAEQKQLIDAAIADLLVLARDHDRPRTAVEAWNAIRGWAEREARLLNLDQQEHHLAIEVIDAELRVLKAEIGPLPPAGAPPLMLEAG